MGGKPDEASLPVETEMISSKPPAVEPPMERDSLSDALTTSAQADEGAIKPLFADRTASGIMVHLSVLSMSAMAILPVWTSSSLADSYYSAPEDFDKTIQTAGNNWRESPVQGHWHRFGVGYQVLLYVHIICGVALFGLVFLLAFTFIAQGASAVGGACRAPFALTAARVKDCYEHRFRQCFVAIWTVNITAAITMAYCRMIFHGFDACNWNQGFGLGFFALFYFFVLIVLQSLKIMVAAGLDASERSVLQWIVMRLTTNGTLIMFVLGIAAISAHDFNAGDDACNAEGVLVFSQKTALLLLVSLVFGVQPVVLLVHARAEEIGYFRTWNRRFVLELAVLTLMMITFLTEAINITYKFGLDSSYPILVIVVVYFVAIRVLQARLRGEYAQGATYPFCWICLTPAQLAVQQKLLDENKIPPPSLYRPSTWVLVDEINEVEAGHKSMTDPNALMGFGLVIGWVLGGVAGFCIGRFGFGSSGAGLIGFWVALGLGGCGGVCLSPWLPCVYPEAELSKRRRA